MVSNEDSNRFVSNSSTSSFLLGIKGNLYESVKAYLSRNELALDKYIKNDDDKGYNGWEEEFEEDFTADFIAEEIQNNAKIQSKGDLDWLASFLKESDPRFLDDFWKEVEKMREKGLVIY